MRESLWERQFDRDPGVLGGVLDLGGERRTVVGIVPDDYRFPSSGEIWTPLDATALAGPEADLPGGAVARRAFSAVLAGAGAVALDLALVGLYAIVSFTVTRRTRELGIRIALGAAPCRILVSVFGRAAAQLSVGGVWGAGFAALLVALRASIFAASLPAAEPWVLPAVALLLAAAGLAACHAPARRAIAIDPSRALTQE